jgi:hypothetical protein
VSITRKVRYEIKGEQREIDVIYGVDFTIVEEGYGLLIAWSGTPGVPLEVASVRVVPPAEAERISHERNYCRVWAPPGPDTPAVWPRESAISDGSVWRQEPRSDATIAVQRLVMLRYMEVGRLVFAQDREGLSFVFFEAEGLENDRRSLAPTPDQVKELSTFAASHLVDRVRVALQRQPPDRTLNLAHVARLVHAHPLAVDRARAKLIDGAVKEMR